jgi:hypothetical protein
MAYFIFLKYLDSLEDVRKNPHVKFLPKSTCAIFQTSTKFLKSIEIRKEFLFDLWPISSFWPSCNPPPLSPALAHRPASPVAFGHPTRPFPLLPRWRVVPGHASSGRHPSPVPWREADPPRPLPLPLLYWPPPPPPLPVTGAHRHQWCRLHFTVAWSPPSPSAPIKGTPAAPHLAAPHTALFSSYLTPELVPTARLQPSSHRLIARPPHRRSPSGEALDGTSCSTPPPPPLGRRPRAAERP